MRFFCFFLGMSLLALVSMGLGGVQQQASPLKITKKTDFGMQVSFVKQALTEVGKGQSISMPIPLPDGSEVLANLQRVDQNFIPAQALLYVNDQPTKFRIGETSNFVALSGSIAGDADSHVYLAYFDPGHLVGTISSKTETYHIVPDNQGNTFTSYVIAESTYAAAGQQPQTDCKLDNVFGGKSPLKHDARKDLFQGRSLPTGILPNYEMRVTLETDFQFFQIWGNLAATEGYALALSGAVSERYREQVGVVATYPYLGIYTNSNDPWSQQDSGGDCVDVLFEFQAAWDNGNAPVTGDVYHMLSGANLGCGVAYLDVLCDQDFSFSVSGNISGQVPFPVTQGPLNWDFMVMAHEIGHNVATPHTHDYCPPLDQCAPPGFFGPCQTQQVCTNQGTIMSYCHLCSGGLSNITTFFHTQVVSVMRTAVESSCLQLFEGLFTNDLGFALPGAGGTPNLTVSYTNQDPAAFDTINFDVSNAKPSTLTFFILGFSTQFLPFQGGTIVPAFNGVKFFTPTDAGGNLNLFLDIAPPLSVPDGAFFWTQVWIPEGGGSWAATNAVETELVYP